MTRRHRLSGRGAFRAVRSRGLAASGGVVRVALLGNTVGMARIGYILPRAVGGAVVRNRLRRRLRAAVRPELVRLAGLDVVVSAGPPAAALAFADLRRAVLTAVARAEARRGPGTATAAGAGMGDNAGASAASVGATPAPSPGPGGAVSPA